MILLVFSSGCGRSRQSVALKVKRQPFAISQAQSGDSDKFSVPFGSRQHLCNAELGAGQPCDVLPDAAGTRVKRPEPSFETAIRISGQTKHTGLSKPKRLFFVFELW
jgi:hypothetical protein